MAYSVDWINKIISIPKADLSLISGNRYSLSLSDFHKEVRRLEASFADGLWADQILDHTNPKLDFSGADYAAFDEVINGYYVKFDNVNVDRVDLLGANNNILDVLISNGVSVASFNSGGKQITPAIESAIDIADAVLDRVG